MTPEEARRLAPGDKVYASHTIPRWAPHVVTEVWINAAGTIARIAVKGRKGWLDAAAWHLSPPL